MASQYLFPFMWAAVIGILIAVIVICFMVIRRMNSSTNHFVRSLYVGIATISFAEILYFLAARHPTIIEFLLCISFGLHLLCDRRSGLKPRKPISEVMKNGTDLDQ